MKNKPVCLCNNIKEPHLPEYHRVADKPQHTPAQKMKNSYTKCLSDCKKHTHIVTLSDKPKYTPTPFNVLVGIANADLSDDQRVYIIRAVTAYEELVRIAKRVQYVRSELTGNAQAQAWDKLTHEIDEAIAKAEGK